MLVSFFASRYNFFVPLDSTTGFLFSAFSGAVIQLSGLDSCRLAAVLCGEPIEIACEQLSDELQAQLIHGGFLTHNPEHQMDEIRRRYRQARSEYPLVLTLTTTMDCNLGCYYCYEQRSRDALGLLDVESIVQLARSRLAKGTNGTFTSTGTAANPFSTLISSKALRHVSKSLQLTSESHTAPRWLPMERAGRTILPHSCIDTIFGKFRSRSTG
jgi:hypothetical protein